ncbi:MAG: hypothetical protein KBD15_03510 [Candidatus Magasanikbacteria bacterium]|nr:hypothetical protein [Candidatus Magasanikbacteria bacterium]
MKNILKGIFHFALGGLVGTLMINFLVIAQKTGTLSTPQEQAIYSLHDDLLSYVISFLGLAALSLIIIGVQSLRSKKK